MNYFISDALAQGSAPSGGGLMSFLPLIVIFVLFYFLLIRPQQKKAKDHRQMVSGLAKGDEVVTNGGTLGKIVGLDDNFISVEVAKGVAIKVQRHAIAAMMPKGTYK
ncbi:MAG TPA: preprotein translocase subunit YajC [Acidiferrobacteraceae bacterium]|nr:preprotein translocase subunit YajC [Acidiferrobacteraceae bacterium]